MRPECYELEWRSRTQSGGHQRTPAKCGPCPWELPCSEAVKDKFIMLRQIKKVLMPYAGETLTVADIKLKVRS